MSSHDFTCPEVKNEGECRFKNSAIFKKISFLPIYGGNTVKLGYNELGYSELSAIANKKIRLVGSGLFNGSVSRL